MKADRFAPKLGTGLYIGDCRELLPRLEADHDRGPLKFPRALNEIL